MSANIELDIKREELDFIIFRAASRLKLLNKLKMVHLQHWPGV